MNGKLLSVSRLSPFALSMSKGQPKPSGLLLLLAFALLEAFLWSPNIMAASLEREPAFRDNFYSVEIRGHLSWIVGYYGTLLHSRDRGLSWEVQNSETREALFRVVFVDEQRGWVSGSYGKILHTSSGGRNWQTQQTPTREHLFGLTFGSEGLGWAVGSRGTVLHTEDGGASWVNRPVTEDVILNDVSFIDARQGWVVGEFGRIYRSRDGGRTWLKQQSPIEVSFVSGQSRNLFRLLFPNSEAGWAFGLDGVILRTRNGERWDVIHQDGASLNYTKRHHLFSASVFGGKKWAVGERGTLLVAAVGDDQWRTAGLRIPPVTLNGIAFGHDGFGLIVGNRGLVFRTEDGGKQWKQIPIVPKAPGKGVSKFP